MSRRNGDRARFQKERKRKTEAAWFPYSTRNAKWIERLMGLLFR